MTRVQSTVLGFVVGGLGTAVYLVNRLHGNFHSVGQGWEFFFRAPFIATAGAVVGAFLGYVFGWWKTDGWKEEMEPLRHPAPLIAFLIAFTLVVLLLFKFVLPLVLV